MPRLLAPQQGCIEVDVPSGRRYRGNILAAEGEDARLLRAAGYTAADVAGGPSRARGFTCTDCGFVAFIATCGRCGGSCERT